MRSSLLRCWVLWTCAAFAPIAIAADDPCAGFRWDIRHERALFATAAEPVSAGQKAESAPALAPDKLYELTLTPQERVTLAASSGKKSPMNGGFAGLGRLRVPATGDYRVSMDKGFWVDIVDDRALIAPSDFQGRADCQAPHKIVVYSLSEGRDLIVQLSGVGSSLRLTITPVRAVSGR